jgi:hypothetical protein
MARQVCALIARTNSIFLTGRKRQVALRKCSGVLLVAFVNVLFAVGVGRLLGCRWLPHFRGISTCSCSCPFPAGFIDGLPEESCLAAASFPMLSLVTTLRG